MELLGIVAGILNLLILLYIFVLLARLVFEYIPIFNREWRPRGGMLVLAEIVYTLTDPPIRMFRRFIPPIRIGPIALDLGFALTMLLCFILLGITRTLAQLG